MRGVSFDPVAAEVFERRVKKVTLVVLFVFLVLVLRLWFLQIVHGPAYRVQSENNRIHLQDIPPFRGMMFDRHGELLVDNRPSYDMYIIPEDVEDNEVLVRSLEALIGLSAETVEERLDREAEKNPFRPVLIKKNMSREELAIIETNLFNLPGVMIQVKPQRHYIYRETASHLIGYLGEISDNQLNTSTYPDGRPGDMIGKYGVEGKWQRYLSGQRGGEQVEVDASGRRLRVISRKPPLAGLDISLTIDKGLQLVAEEGLQGKKGAIVAMNPKNGEILAMASSPAFDPNMFIEGMEKGLWTKISSSRNTPLQNRSIAGQYPPGSTFKIVVALAGLEEGLVDPRESVHCEGSFTMGSHTYRCWRKQGHGSVSFHRALVESCDVYFYKLGKRLGVDRIAHYAMMCGLGKKPGFDLGYEKEGLIPTSKWKLKRMGIPWHAGETISVAIGQSYVLVTPIQMASLISAVFNGGTIYQPTAIRWVGKDEKRVHEFRPTALGHIKAKKETFDLLRSALIGAVNEPGGTGGRARVKDVTVAGKTGTAQVVTFGREKALARGSSYDFEDHAWFVAIAPAEDPQIALAILIENGGHGGSAAAPVAREMIAAYLGKN